MPPLTKYWGPAPPQDRRLWLLTVIRLVLEFTAPVSHHHHLLFAQSQSDNIEAIRSKNVLSKHKHNLFINQRNMISQSTIHCPDRVWPHAEVRKLSQSLLQLMLHSSFLDSSPHDSDTGLLARLQAPNNICSLLISSRISKSARHLFHTHSPTIKPMTFNSLPNSIPYIPCYNFTEL